MRLQTAGADDFAGLVGGGGDERRSGAYAGGGSSVALSRIQIWG